MSNRLAKNIEYKKFLTSVNDEDDGISCNKLEIPEFQRNFVWKPNNIKDLIDSIRENGKNYYLGNIVIVKDGSGRSKIVDGQQRLITLSLIAKRLIDITNSQKNKENLEKIIWAGKGVLRILFQKSNLRDLYEKLLISGRIDIDLVDGTQNILLNASKAIDRECETITNVEEFIENFLSLEFVVIISPSDEDAYQLFEGLNSTGLSLSAVELTKNSILGKIKNLDSSRIGEAVEIWDSIEKSFENTNINWFNKFLRHQWFSKKGYVGSSNLFREVKDKVIKGSNVDSLFKYLDELKKDSLIYISFRTANLNKNDFDLGIHGEAWSIFTKLIYFIKTLELDQIYSVLLSLYKYGKNEKQYFRRGETLKKHIEKLWGFLLIVKYTKISPSSFERDFADVCSSIQTLGYNSFKDKMKFFFACLSKKIEEVEKDFSTTLNNSIDYSIDDRGMIRLILEDYLTFEGDGADSDIETEHIVPENNIDKWANAEDRERLMNFVGKIGNLTLIKNTLNNDAGDRCFDEKFDIAYSKSRFSLNNSLKDDWGAAFNSKNPIDEAILPRGLKIGEVIYRKYFKNLLEE